MLVEYPDTNLLLLSKRSGIVTIVAKWPSYASLTKRKRKESKGEKKKKKKKKKEKKKKRVKSNLSCI